MGDFVIMLSSETISTIVEAYFNKVTFKSKVEIVDLKPTDTGYMFEVAYAKPQSQVREIPTAVVSNGKRIRNEKGRFVTHANP